MDRKNACSLVCKEFTLETVKNVNPTATTAITKYM
jgi:hypothetical protein